MKTGTRSIVAGALALLVIEMAAIELVHTMSMQTDAALTVPQADREAEAARLKALGADLSTDNPVLERPWDPPYTRRSFVVPQAWFKTRLPDSVSADALGLDLPILEHLMERAYGGWDVARKRGWDWHKWFTDWEAMLNAHAGKSLTLADAFAPMKQLMAFQLDNHTTIPLRGPRFGSGSQSTVIARAPNAACPEFKTTAGAVVPLDVHDLITAASSGEALGVIIANTGRRNLHQLAEQSRRASVDSLRRRMDSDGCRLSARLYMNPRARRWRREIG